jgi:hypothetical protein
MVKKSILFAAAILIAWVPFAQAQVQGFTASGNAVINLPGEQSDPSAVSIGNNKFVLTWQEIIPPNGPAQGDSTCFYAVVDLLGQAALRNEVSPGNPLAQRNIEACADGNGGFFATWEQHDSTQGWDIMAQHYSGAGMGVWNGNRPVAVCTFMGNQSNPHVYAGTGGSAFVVWSDARNGNQDIMVQEFNNNGQEQLSPNGFPLSAAPGDQLDVAGVSDGSGGLFVTWRDARSAAKNLLYIQALNSTGIEQMTAGGKNVGVSISMGGKPSIALDGAGGFYVAWADGRTSTDTNIYMQRFASGGAEQWTAGGVTVCDTTRTQSSPSIVTDNSGGAIVAWLDKRTGNTFTDVYAQRMDNAGSRVWGGMGNALTISQFDQFELSIASNQRDGAIVAWTDQRGSGGAAAAARVYTQMIDGNGTVRWLANGFSVALGNARQAHPTVIAANLSDYAMIVWEDSRNLASNNLDIYLQKIGYAAVPSVSRSTVPFGVVRTHADHRDTIRLKNTGTDTLIVNDYVYAPVVDTDSVMVAVSPAVTYKIPPTVDSVVTINFRPRANTPAVSDTLIFSTNGLGTDSTRAVVVTGSGKYPHIATKMPRDSMTFGKVRVGTQRDSSFVLRNTGSDTLHTFNSSIQGPAQAEFTDSNALNLTIRPGDSARVFVRLIPANVGSKSAFIQFITDDSLNPFSVKLNATGIFPKFHAVQASLQYGKARIKASASKSVTIQNTGTDYLTITALSIGGGDSTMYAVDPSTALPITILPSKSANIRVNFTPDSTLTYRSTLFVTADDTAAAHEIFLQGTGTNSSLQFISTLDFGTILTTVTKDSTFGVVYSAPDTVMVLSGTIEGSTKFAIVPPTPAFPFFATSGVSRSITVRYSPTDTSMTDTARLVLAVRYGTSTFDTLSVSLLGVSTTSGIAEGSALPVGLTLSSTFPQPLASRGTLHIESARAIEHASVNVYSAAGARLAIIFSGTIPAGNTDVAIDAQRWGAGSYLYTIETPAGTAARIFTVVK